MKRNPIWKKPGFGGFNGNRQFAALGKTPASRKARLHAFTRTFTRVMQGAINRSNRIKKARAFSRFRRPGLFRTAFKRQFMFRR